MLKFIQSMQISDKVRPVNMFNELNNMPFGKGYVEFPVSKSDTLKDLKICFCIDTNFNSQRRFCGNISYLRVAASIIKKWSNYFEHKPSIISFNYEAKIVKWKDIKPSNKNNFYDAKYRTTLMSIIENEEAVQAIKNAQVLVIITCDTNYSMDVIPFGKYLREHMNHLKATISIISGRRSDPSSGFVRTPLDFRTPILMSAMFSNNCVLIYNTKTIFVMWADGSFRKYLDFQELNLDTSWEQVTETSFSALSNMKIDDVDDDLRNTLISKGYFSIGNGRYMNMKQLLNYNHSTEEILSLPYETICFYYRSYENNLDGFLDWFIQKRHEYVLFYVKQITNKIDIDLMFDDVKKGNTKSFIDLQKAILDIDNIENNCRGEIVSKNFKRFDNIISYIYCESMIRLYVISLRLYCPFKYCSSMTYPEPSMTRTSQWLDWCLKYYRNDERDEKTECSLCKERNCIPFIVVKKLIKIDTFETDYDLSENIYDKLVCASCASLICYLNRCPDGGECIGLIPVITLNHNRFNIFLKLYNKITDYPNHRSNVKNFTNYDRIIRFHTSLINSIGDVIENSIVLNLEFNG